MNQPLEDLKEAVELNYQCRAEHIRSAAVCEIFGEELWEGVVEVFDLFGFVAARRCYAWLEGVEARVTMLELPPVTSPLMALRLAHAQG
ncbi:MAG: hypothetical protein QOH88_433 [Verrucomicrobiota bacterium]|jgi:hypothetical protein